MKPSARSVTFLDGARAPFGTAALSPGAEVPAASRLTIDLDGARYVEEEFLLSGSAGTWETGDPGAPRRRDDGIPYRTRVLVRRPSSLRDATGVTHVEPLHPHRDAGLTWDALAPHLLRRGDAWVGVTVFPDVARLMRDELDPGRYGHLLVPGLGTEWDVLSDALGAVRENALGALETRRIVLSGWSATGSVCRVFAREGFATARGGLVDGIAIVISSGGAGPAGYPPLTPDAAMVDLADPRRTVRDVGVPVFEILSETESETHRAQLRDDSDDAGDTYRLYQLAGAAHIEDWPGRHATNAQTLAAAGHADGAVPMREALTDARSDLVVRALFDRLVDAIDGHPAPRAPRFAYETGDVLEERMLRRDADGNVLGGIRTPWIEAALAAYAPHGTPAAEGSGPDWTPMANAGFAARLTGTMTPFPPAEVRRRFPSRESYREAFTASTDVLLADRMLLADDAGELISAATRRWEAAAGAADATAVPSPEAGA